MRLLSVVVITFGWYSIGLDWLNHVWRIKELRLGNSTYIVQVKGLTTEELAARNDLVLALPARIEAIPDGTAGGPKNTSAWAPSTTSRPDIKFDSGDSTEVALFNFCIS